MHFVLEVNSLSLMDDSSTRALVLSPLTSSYNFPVPLYSERLGSLEEPLNVATAPQRGEEDPLEERLNVFLCLMKGRIYDSDGGPKGNPHSRRSSGLGVRLLTV
jgi:hypothetical protein